MVFVRVRSTNHHLNFLDSGRFADFTINCAGHSWKLHRVVISRNSDYFSKLCDAKFKEESDQAATLEEDDPRLLARLIVYMYCNCYPVSGSGNTLHERSLRKLLGCDLDFAENPQGESQQPLSLHAALYGLADKYACTYLKTASQNAYIETLRKDFLIPDFISSINIVYETTPEADKGLRKWAIWVSQGYMDMMQLHPGFKALFLSREDFAWDIATQYQRVTKFWCASCNTPNQSKPTCECGNSGICAKSAECRNERLEDRVCSNCRAAGQIVPWSAAPASDNPRQLFKSDVTEAALSRDFPNV